MILKITAWLKFSRRSFGRFPQAVSVKSFRYPDCIHFFVQCMWTWHFNCPSVRFYWSFIELIKFKRHFREPELAPQKPGDFLKNLRFDSPKECEKACELFFFAIMTCKYCNKLLIMSFISEGFETIAPPTGHIWFATFLRSDTKRFCSVR